MVNSHFVDIAVGEAACNYAGAKVADRPVADACQYNIVEPNLDGLHGARGKLGLSIANIYYSPLVRNQRIL
jgi:hypothetical protein